MIEEGRFTAFVIVALALVFIGYGVARLARKYPGTAMAGFSSSDSLRKHYRFAMDSIRAHRWLASIPIWLILSYYILRIPAFIIGQRALEGAGMAFETEPVPLTAGSVGEALVLGARNLFSGHLAYFTSISPVAIVVLFIILIRPSFLLNRLASYAGGRDVQGFAFVEKSISLIHLLFLVTAIPLIFSIILRRWQLVAPLTFAAAGVARVGAILMTALVSGFVIFFVGRLATGVSSDRGAALCESLPVTRSLFYLHLMIMVPLTLDVFLPAVLMFPISLATYFGWGPKDPITLPATLWRLLSFRWQYVALVISLVFVAAPLGLLRGDMGLRGLLRVHFTFIGKHLVKYSIFALSGVFLIFLPYLFRAVMYAAVDPQTTGGLLVDMIADTVAIFLAVIFLLALIKFYLVTSREEPASASHQAVSPRSGHDHV